MLCEASLHQFIMCACSIYQTTSRHMTMTGSHIEHISRVCVLPAALGTERRMIEGVLSPCLSIMWSGLMTSSSSLLLTHHKVRQGFRIDLLQHTQAQVNSKYDENTNYWPIRPAKWALLMRKNRCTIQWNILLIQSYLTCPAHARFITLLKHPIKASLGPSSHCIIHVECFLLQTHWVSRSFSSELWPRRAGCPTG